MLKNFFIPTEYAHDNACVDVSAVIILPTFKPTELTIRLVYDILRWNKGMHICIVDDHTPESYEREYGILSKIKLLSPDIEIVRTPENKLKAGAINYGIKHIVSTQKNTPQIIITMDDDVVISQNTISNLIKNLLQDKRFGVVCSQCLVKNKNVNLLTRLQALEYFGFNALRLADEGFILGPLVMHGMLSAYRYEALAGVNYFREKHLIEDYEITARIKRAGWHVRLAPDSYAWTKVPETWFGLWKQRTRWTVGGILVLLEIHHWKVLLQDFIGHSIFLLTLGLIGLSFVLEKSTGIPSVIPTFILVISFVQALIWYVFQLWFLRFYKERDIKDNILRVLLIPEFLYANMLAVLLIGSYIFIVVTSIVDWLAARVGFLKKIQPILYRGFKYIGYSRGWGTR